MGIERNKQLDDARGNDKANRCIQSDNVVGITVSSYDIVEPHGFTAVAPTRASAEPAEAARLRQGFRLRSSSGGQVGGHPLRIPPRLDRRGFLRRHLSEHYRTVTYARGALAIVAFGAVPARVDDELIDSIRSRLSDGVLTIQPQTFRPGQTVRIHSGPFSGLEAVFQYEMTGQQRAVVLLRCLAYQARMALPMEHVANK